MPTYDYVCDACDHKFELFQSMMAPVKRKCPNCGKQKLRRLIGTGAAIMFKGSGFYKTDYRSEGYKKQAAADKPSESTESKSNGAESKSSTAAESKPSGGSETKVDKSKSRKKK